jgi:inorganic triphosphatase YgiF
MGQIRSELEVKFVIISQNPDRFLQKISNLKKIGNLKLAEKGKIRIRDIYFEKTPGLLQQEKIALRIRQTKEKYYITLKGKSNIYSSGAIRRLEIEELWNQKSLGIILEELSRAGIELNTQNTAFHKNNPIQTLEETGLTVLQDRESIRQAFDVFSNENPDETLAEMVIDTVDFHFKGQALRHHEIEIELTSPENVSAFTDSIQFFKEEFPTDLQVWTYSKLETGLALEKLYQDRGPNKFSDKDGNITPEAYQLIERYI